MPQRDYKTYAKTPSGAAARAKAAARYVAKRRTLKPWKPDPAPLLSAISTWSQS